MPARPTPSLSTVNHSPGFGAPLSIEAVLDAAADAGWPAVGLDTWSIAAFLAAGGPSPRWAGCCVNGGWPARTWWHW